MKYVPPSVTETAFNCPHCGALTTQFWFKLRAEALRKDDPCPKIVSYDDFMDFSNIENAAYRTKAARMYERLQSGQPFFEDVKDGEYTFHRAHNVHISKCYNCTEVALWIYDRLVHPRRGEAPPANPDLPADIRRDYDEASSILDQSPRGAAALIRLCIQKLCIELGKPGRDLNKDIGALVSDGLSSKVQRALDAVRVIGNEAVHPGELNLRDDRATAETLFKLLNLIAEKMISEPKHVDEVYNTLPIGKLQGIEERDKKGKRSLGDENL